MDSRRTQRTVLLSLYSESCIVVFLEMHGDSGSLRGCFWQRHFFFFYHLKVFVAVEQTWRPSHHNGCNINVSGCWHPVGTVASLGFVAWLFLLSISVQSFLVALCVSCRLRQMNLRLKVKLPWALIVLNALGACPYLHRTEYDFSVVCSNLLSGCSC